MPADSETTARLGMPRRIPFVAASLTAATLLLHSLGARVFDGLSLDRAAVSAGQWHRLITGHFIHVNASHLAWDLAVLAALGAFIECRGRRSLISLLIASAFGISAAVLLGCPQINTYVGLSGVDTALFGWVVALWIRRAGRLRALGWVGLLTTLAKIGYEFAVGRTAFVDLGADDFRPLPAAHLAGFLIGLSLHAFIHAWRGRRAAAASGDLPASA